MDEKTNAVPYGYCHCNCGEKTSLLSGRPKRFIKGHGRYKPIEKRFWAKVDRRMPTECWPWLGCRQKRSGYGTIGKERGAERGSMLAHRCSWEIHNKKSAGHLYVLHTCDHPWCVNPSHLYLGDQFQNMQDMSLRGRSKKGRASELQGQDANGAKLTDVRVLEARMRRSAGESYASIGKSFGVSWSTIRKAVLGITWGQVR